MKKIYLLTGTLCISIASMAQSPGGVAANLRLWLRADASGTLSSTDSLNSWSYFNSPSNVTPGSAVFVSQVHNRPIVQHSTFNFLPSVFFNGAQQMDGPTGNSAPFRSGSGRSGRWDRAAGMAAACGSITGTTEISPRSPLSLRQRSSLIRPLPR